MSAGWDLVSPLRFFVFRFPSHQAQICQVYSRIPNKGGWLDMTFAVAEVLNVPYREGRNYVPGGIVFHGHGFSVGAEMAVMMESVLGVSVSWKEVFPTAK